MQYVFAGINYTGSYPFLYRTGSMLQKSCSVIIPENYIKMKAFTITAKPVIGFLVFLFTCLHQANGQKTQDNKSVIQSSVDARNFIFVAQTAMPLRGGLRQLTSYYDLKVSKDTVVSNLPYFGRAYTAPMNPSDGGLTFTSLSSGYEVKLRKKGRKEITINTKSADDTQRMLLSVFDNGTASLQVSSNNRDPITFSGYVREINSKL